MTAPNAALSKRWSPALALALSLSAAACQPKVDPVAPTVATEDGRAEYEAFVTDFFSGFFDRFPVTATMLGEHGGDGRWPALDPASEADHLAWIEGMQSRADALQSADLDVDAKVDLGILRDQLALAHLELADEARWSSDPLAWTTLVGNGIDYLINRDYGPVEARAQSLVARLEALPALLEVAAERLAVPERIKAPSAKVAQQQLQGLRILIRDEIPKRTAGIPEALAGRLVVAGREARNAIDAFEARTLSPAALAAAKGSWRLGEASFETKLGHVLGGPVDAAELHERALAEHQKVRARMEELAFELYPALFGRPAPASADELGRARIVREVLEELSNLHPNGDALKDACEAKLQTISSFVEAKELIPLDDAERLEVIWTPPHQQGVAIAGLDAPPPLDEGESLQSFYLVQPIPSTWAPPLVESFLREYNDFMLEILSIHEAIPGHFVQLYYAKREPSMVRRVFSNGAFVEGWAVYTERVMTDAGYPGVDITAGRERPEGVSEALWKLAGDPALRAKAIELHGAKFFLRTVTNAVLDYEIHVGQMDENAAVELMVQRAYQQEGEARAKWVRAQVTSTQLSTYFVGASAWFDLRAAAQAAPDFSASKWHAAVLSHGAPPVVALPKLMESESTAP